MKKLKIIIILKLLLFGLIFPSNSSVKPLADIYRSGKLDFLRIFTIGRDSFPENAPLGVFMDFAVSDDGKIFIPDYRMNNIKIFDSNGIYVKTIGQKGGGPGDLSGPAQITCIRSQVIIWENRNKRFSIFSTNGNFVTTIRPERSIFMVKRIRSLHKGYFVIETESWNSGKNQEIDLELYQVPLTKIKTLFSQQVSTMKRITHPVRTMLPKPFAPKIVWDAAQNGDIVFGSQDSENIYIMTKGGNMKSFAHKCQKTRVSKEDREAYFSGFQIAVSTGAIKREVPKYILDNTKFPEYKPYFENIVVDSENNILVFPPHEGKGKYFFSFHAFEPDGTFINMVKMAGGFLTESPKILFGREGSVYALFIGVEEAKINRLDIKR